MKKSFISAFLVVAALHADEAIDTPASLIDPIVKLAPAGPPQPAPKPDLEIAPEDILSTEVIVTEEQTTTIQEIAPVEIAPLPQPPPPQPLTAEQIAERQARFANRSAHRMLLFSGTVYDDTHTQLRWSSQGRQPVEHFIAWSNVNFHYFDSLHRFQKNGTTYSLMYGIGDENTAKAAARYARFGRPYTPPVIPTLPADPTLEPTFIVTQGNPTAEDLAPIRGLHELYAQHHNSLIAEYQRLKTVRAQEAAARAANPPDPTPDIIIRHWTIQPQDENANNKEGEQAQ